MSGFFPTSHKMIFPQKTGPSSPTNFFLFYPNSLIFGSNLAHIISSVIFPAKQDAMGKNPGRCGEGALQ
jgi:hypothetical protein